ncbi:hypothetical protein [Streptomyces sioyaensis]|uniref:hypothetical protein n=1 Tax=Streptomyces sioyaensis TaxID=67364 RepID=UPI0036E128FF
MRNSIITVVAAAALAAGASMGMAPAAGAGPAQAAVAWTGHHGKSMDRGVRRIPAKLAAADVIYSPGCSSTTLPIDCTITEPVVTQRETTYPFAFLPGDHVTVSGGGCVQTGGHGLTWKR